MTTTSGRARRPSLKTQIAIALFDWQWREDWECWCPPGWPPHDMINPPYLDKLHTLERHGADPHGRDGTDSRGRPVIPDYRYDPKATEILWQWLHAQPEIQSIRFMPLPIPPESLQGVRPWRCEIVTSSGQVITGEGTNHKGALCYAVLMLAKTQAARVA